MFSPPGRMTTTIYSNMLWPAMHRDPEVIGLSDSAVNHEPEEDFEFDCPECGTHIQGEVDRCPKCGVEFVIEEVAEIECPQCHATIPGESEILPQVRSPLRRSPPPRQKSQDVERSAPIAKEVEEQEEGGPAEGAPGGVLRAGRARSAPLLALAKDYSIDTTATRRLIDKAVGSGQAPGDRPRGQDHEGMPGDARPLIWPTGWSGTSCTWRTWPWWRAR